MKFLITYNSGKQIVTCSSKKEALRVAKEAQKLLGWVWFKVDKA